MSLVLGLEHSCPRKGWLGLGLEPCVFDSTSGEYQFFNVWFYPTDSRSRAYRFSSRRTIQSTSDKIRLFLRNYICLVASNKQKIQWTRIRRNSQHHWIIGNIWQVGIAPIKKYQPHLIKRVRINYRYSILGV